MKAYPEYKASGIDWLGEIPSHWNIVRLGLLFNAKAGGDAKPELYSLQKDLLHPFPVYTNSQVENQVHAYTSEAPFKSGSITVTGRGDIGRAFLRKEDFDAIIRLIVLSPINEVDCNYYKYFIDTVIPFLSDSAAVGQLSASQITKYLLAVPPLSEQQAIADFLDDKTAKINELISEKRKQVEDIRAYRTSLITETVTHGLNPDAPLRPSGIDWLGYIPEHWNVVNLKYLINEPLMYGANESPEIETNLSNPRYIRITDIDENGCLKKDTFRTLQLDKAQPYFLKYGDILFARSGATVGKTYRFTEDYSAAFAGYLIKASCGPKIDSLFLLYYTNTQCYNNWKNSIFDKSTIQNIAADKYNNLPIVVPPLAEQQAIADFLDAKTAKIDELISELTKQIDELTEYKQAVITEAVTGKVDVRDYKPSN